jgi:putative nucleotidyltransferase with HDIG domain
MEELDQYINRVKNLPPAPKVLPKLLSLLNDPNSDTSKVVELISFDPGLTANVLQRCNSAFFGAAMPASDIQEAVGRLGFSQVYQVIAAVTGSRTLSPPQKGYGYARGELWKHSVATAVASQRIAECVGEDGTIAFTGGLLHDIGKIILADALEHIYIKLVEETEKNQQSLLETEKKLLGVQHAEIGGRLLAIWKFPADLVASVWFHHQPDSAVTHERIASCVYLGNMIAHFMGFSYGHQAFAFRGRVEALSSLNISSDQLPHFMIETFEKLETVEALFQLQG